MKRYIFIYILILAAAFGARANSLTAQADSAYMNDDFSTAAALYHQIAETEGTSSNLFYNLGNCYFRLGQPGRAILWYERALRLDPRNADARTNLAFVNSRITDEPGDRGMFISNSVNRIARSMPANFWAASALGAFILFLGCVGLYIFTPGIGLRKLGFFGAIVMIGLCVLANILASRATRWATSSNEAVIVVPSTLLSTSPREPKDRSEEAVLLHEGTLVEIVDSVSTRVDSTTVKWYDVQVDNHVRAWIKGAAIEKI